MLATYASFALLLGAASLVGQAVFALAGRRTASWLAPAVGLGPLAAIAWAAVRLPGEGTAAAIALGAVAAACLAGLRGRVEGAGGALRAGLPVALLALAAASLPFAVEGRFGILGTGLNPDMSQHLFAADRLASGGAERLVNSGYPLGPHSLVVALSALGPSLVHGFDGLTLAVAVAAALAPLSLLGELPAGRRIAAALLVGLPYMAASYLIQGAFKETIEALLLLAFAIALHEFGRGTLLGDGRERLPTGALPLAALAIGAVYAYSFPGLIWLGAAAALWLVLSRPRGVVPAALGGIVVLAVAAAPEIGRMIDFGSFETFNPSGAGLGNLFNRLSPLEALGVWPSGDFRLDPGDGSIPAAVFYLGGAVGAVALAAGIPWWLRRRELAVPAALAAGALLWAYALISGTPYQEAKAIVLAAPLAMLVAVLPLVSEPIGRALPLRAGLALAFMGAAGGCSLLALANGPVGPASYSPGLAELRHGLGADSTLVLASPELLNDEHGRDFIVWELRGGRVCVDEAGAPSRRPPPAGDAHVITQGGAEAPYGGLRRERTAGGYTLWRRDPAPGGHGSCPAIDVANRAEPASAAAQGGH
jgi:hypothetical protein